MYLLNFPSHDVGCFILKRFFNSWRTGDVEELLSHQQKLVLFCFCHKCIIKGDVGDKHDGQASVLTS